jgi:hypothetical protein
MKISVTKEYDIQKEVFVSSCKWCPCFNEDADRTEDRCKLGYGGGDYDGISRGCPLNDGGSILISREERAW